MDYTPIPYFRTTLINKAIDQAKVAILLVSANFLSSDLLDREIPKLLKRRQNEELIVFPVIAKQCPWKNVDWLKNIEVRPKNGQPVWRDNGIHADHELSKVAEEVARLVKTNDARKEFQSSISKEKPKLNLRTLWDTQVSQKPTHLLASSDYICVVTKDVLHFLSPDNGEPLLSPVTAIGEFSLTDYKIIGGAVDADGNLLITLLPFHLSDRARLFSLQFSHQNGTVTVRWRYEAPSTQLSTPVTDNNIIYFVQQGPELVMLESEYGKRQNIIPLPETYKLHRDCVSFVLTATCLFLALCNGKILTKDRQREQTFTTLYQASRRLSPLATDGLRLFFGTSVRSKSAVSSRVYAWDTLSRREIWNFEMPPDTEGRHQSVEGQPLIIGNFVCVAGRNRYLHILEINSGQEIGNYQMPDRIKLGPVWSGGRLIVADRKGNIQALELDVPVFVVTCHYDPHTPPVLNEWNPLIFTLINVGHKTVQNVILRISGDFEGKSKHHTQQLHTITANGFKRRTVQLKPTSAGASVHLAVSIDYKYDNLSNNSQKLDLYIPVRRSAQETFVQKEVGISENGTRQYNYTALHALLTAALTEGELTQLCFDIECFQPISDKIIASANKSRKISRLIEHADRHQWVEVLLIELKWRNPIRYKQYILEIEHRIQE